jgi:hypothetical protein
VAVDDGGSAVPDMSREQKTAARKRVLFLQLEVFLNCPPHLGMCLFVEDLRQQGVECVTYLVNCNHIEELLSVIRKDDFSLICLDSCFTVDIIHEMTKALPEVPILVGGVNSIALLLHTTVPFAVFGPGRRAIKEFVKEFFGGKDFSKVTNLFFKEGKEIHYSGRTKNWDLAEELFPFEPYLTWAYVGPERSSNADTQAVSIIAGTGCPYSRAVNAVAKQDIGGQIRRLGYKVSKKAEGRLEEIFNQKDHGCSFCVFQLQEHRAHTVSRTTEILLRQAQHLWETHNTSAFHIQTENPFPFLNRFLLQALAQEIPLDFVSIRTRPDTLLQKKAALSKALELAKEHGFHFSIEEVGFESFVDEELQRFDKGVDGATNLKAVEMLRKVKREYGDTLSVHVGHGMILFHPWTTLDSLSRNLKVMAEYNDVFPRFYPLSLTLYSEFLPIFSRVVAEGCAVPADYAYGWDYTQKDPLVTKAYELYQALYHTIGPDMSIGDYLDAVMLVRGHSVEEILFQQFGLEPA